MADFSPFAVAVKSNLDEMSKNELFVVGGIEDIFGAYLGAFPEGTNPIFRARTEHDCGCCKGFIRAMGSIVSIENGALRTIWDANALPAPYDAVAERMSALVKSKAIDTIYRTKEGGYGAESNVELCADDTTIRWHHFHGKVDKRHRSDRPDKDRGDIKTTVHVLRRGLEELTADAVNITLDLIMDNQLYRGEEHKAAVLAFKRMQDSYLQQDGAVAKSIFLWQNAHDQAARFRNTAIGTLVQDLSTGVDIERAVRSFETKVAPTNYKRTTSLITERMIENAVKTLAGLGLEQAIERRHAQISDVSVNNVLFVDNGVRSSMLDAGGSITSLLKSSVKAAPIDTKRAEDISMDDFLSRVVPQSASIELYLENKHLANFASLTAPVHADAGRLFQWDNGFAWSYDGDVTDSVKQRVKKAGGNINADLRVSLAWYNYDDLDLHAQTPNGHIFWSQKLDTFGKQILDVDMNAGGPNTREAVENLAWMRGSSLRDGHYAISVDQFSRRETDKVGFTLEVEHDGILRSYTYDKPVSGKVQCLAFSVAGGVIGAINHAAGLKPGAGVAQEKWGIKTEGLVSVDTLLLSPNHWDGQSGRGNKHWFFILKGCKNPEPVRGIYNEFLRADLNEHRKVFEVLGAKTKCPVVDDQLSGVGFSSTRGDKAVVVVKGDKLNKAFNINF